MSLLLLTGDEYRVKTRLKELLKKVDPSWLAFNYQEVTDVKAALVQARTLPFGGGDRVTVCTTTLFNKKDETLLTVLQDSLSGIPDCSLLVFVAEKADARLKATKWLKQVGESEDFPILTAWDEKGIQQLVSEIAKRLKLKLTPDVVTAIAEAIGPDGYRIESELTKLSGDKPITVESVRALVDNKTQTSLDLAEAFVAGDKARALGLLASLRQLDQHPLQVIATLIGRFEKLFVVGHASGTPDEIAKSAGIGNPKQIYYLKQDAQRMGDRLVRLLPLLLSAEVAIKSGANAEIELERLVIQC